MTPDPSLAEAAAENDALSGGDPSSTPSKRGLIRRRVPIVMVVAIVVGLWGPTVWKVTTQSPTVDSNTLVGRIGESAPPFSLPSLAEPSRNITLSSLRGRPLVINFWASWCVPCRTEMPLLEQAHRKYQDKLTFLGIDTNDTPAAAAAFLRQIHVTYPALSDENGVTANKYGLFGLPTTVFVSATGKIVGRHIGEVKAKTLRDAIAEAFPT